MSAIETAGMRGWSGFGKLFYLKELRLKRS